MLKAEIKLKTAFTDDTFREINWTPIAISAVGANLIRSRVKAFNTSGLSAVEGLYISDDGATCTGITEASIIVTNESEINLN